VGDVEEAEAPNLPRDNTLMNSTARARPNTYISTGMRQEVKPWGHDVNIHYKNWFNF
jgi:hypothetical protein